MTIGSLRSSRGLAVLVLGLTLVPLAILLAVGARLVAEDRALEHHQASERLALAADRVVAALQAAAVADERRLAAGESAGWPDDAVTVTLHAARIDAEPRGRIPYYPVVQALAEAPDAVFQPGDVLEFQRRDLDGAARSYRELTQSSSASVRAAALLRLARVQLEAGRPSDALASYAALTQVDNVAVAGVPMAMAALDARCAILERLDRSADLAIDARRLAGGLTSGRWTIPEAVYRLYAVDAAQWLRVPRVGDPETDALADAVAHLWRDWHTGRPSIPRLGAIDVDGREWVLISATADDSLRAVIATPHSAANRWLDAARDALADGRVRARLIDARGAEAAGSPGVSAQDPLTPRITRGAGETGLPWTIEVAAAPTFDDTNGFDARRRWLEAGFVLLALTVIAAGYAILRAVMHARAVAALQTDFVAAVSHEFRTPLTAMRQFTERLRTHDDLTGTDRLVCYDAQARATDRLSRLVESLLDFASMEGGRRIYRLAPRDCAALVREVVEDFRAQPQAVGRRISFEAAGSALVPIDDESLGRAMWNLLDNAVKYSPDGSTIEVRVARAAGGVAIAVVDHGVGIPADERRAIFAKFQRGDHARRAGIKGTGLGLAIVDHVVRAHRGRIEVESAPDEGSTFTILLPAAERETASALAAAPTGR